MDAKGLSMTTTMMNATPLSRVLRHAVLRRLADERSFVRGEDYFLKGRVGSVVAHGERLLARVRGEKEYTVHISVQGEEPAAACDCISGAAGRFCKHAVAAGLAYLKQEQERADPDRLTLEEVRAHLLAKDRRALVDLLLTRALADDSLREHLLLLCALSEERPEGPHLPTVHAAIARAVPPGPLTYPERLTALNRLAEVAGALEALARRPAHAAAVMNLCEHALSAAQRLGTSQKARQLSRRLSELHLRACRAARPAPLDLARRLFVLEVEQGLLRGTAGAYAQVLGPAGQAALARLTESAWAELSADDRARRARLVYLMEILAWQRGDVG
jgi:hypothetical protein